MSKIKTKEEIARECIERNPESYFDPSKEFIPHEWVLEAMEKYAIDKQYVFYCLHAKCAENNLNLVNEIEHLKKFKPVLIPISEYKPNEGENLLIVDDGEIYNAKYMSGDYEAMDGFIFIEPSHVLKINLDL